LINTLKMFGLSWCYYYRNYKNSSSI